MANAENKKSSVYALPVTVYYNLEPKQVKRKYEMDKFFFEYSDDFEKTALPDKFTLLVKRYRQAVFEATGTFPGKKAEVKNERIKFEETA